MVAEAALLAGVCVAGFGVLRFLRFPTPAFLGALTAAGALNYCYLYPVELSLDAVSFLAKVGLGVTLGRRFDRTVILALKELPVPAVVTAVWMMGASLLSGFVLHAWSDLPLNTALIGSAAGGIMEMAVFAMALGANAVTVTFIQLFRLIVSVMVIPFIARGWSRHLRNKGLPVGRRAAASPAYGTQGRFNAGLYALMAGAALTGGWCCERLGVPAGTMIGAMAGAALVVAPSGRACPVTPHLGSLCQLVLGAVMARSMTHDTIVVLGELFLPLFLPTVTLLILCLALSFVLHRLAGWDSITCLLATMPAGLIQVVPLAEEAGADVVKVAMMHTVRLISIVVFLPWIITAIL